MNVQLQMAGSLHLPQSHVVFPALKDKRSVAVQHASVPGGAPQLLEGNGFAAQIVGFLGRPLTPADIEANRFSIVVRDLSASEAQDLAAGLERAGHISLPNYFDQQRFGSVTPDSDHIAKRILLRDAEGALRIDFTQPFAGDPRHVRTFKASAAARWGDWQAMFEAAPQPFKFRSVLAYLRDQPPASAPSSETVYRKALNRRLLSLYLTAYQSLLWNRIARRTLESEIGSVQGSVGIAAERLPIYSALPGDFNRDRPIPLPHHRATFGADTTAAIADDVLDGEGLTQWDLKPRILTKAYLPRGHRALLLFPQDAFASPVEPDEMFAGRSKLALGFVLPRGSYATLVVRALAASPVREDGDAKR